MMEKQGVIKEGVTPPNEELSLKQTNQKIELGELEKHFTKTASDKAAESIKKNK